MPVTALPSPWGVGTLGEAARHFVDFLAAGGQAYWQVLPVGPTSFGDSPYQSFSTYAGNPYLIDLDDLAAEGLLEAGEYQDLPWGEDPASVDYGRLYNQRFDVLAHAVRRLWQMRGDEVEAWAASQAGWIDDYALFMALKRRAGGASWMHWSHALRHREPAAMARARTELADQLRFWTGVQYLFSAQWRALVAYAHAHDVRIIGDVPIYVAEDSADVWSHPEQFQLDDDLRPIEVAGCPPDGFSATGQLWGNPLFDWERMRTEGYQWWIDRVAYQLDLFDVLRIDHFRGFDSYYAIPAGHADACRGRWREGPGIDFFKKLDEKLGSQQIIAEDLGFLTPSVHRLLEESGYPGMKVLEFAFDSRDGGGRAYQPHRYPRHCVAYVGTHDNPTALGWFAEASPEDAAYAREYLGIQGPADAARGMMRGIWASPADVAVVQMQDLLGLGAEARINTPSTLGGNWRWRMLPGADSAELAAGLSHQMELYER